MILVLVLVLSGCIVGGSFILVLGSFVLALSVGLFGSRVFFWQVHLPATVVVSPYKSVSSNGKLLPYETSI